MTSLDCPCCGDVGAESDASGLYRDGQPTLCGCGGWVSLDRESSPGIVLPTEGECVACRLRRERDAAVARAEAAEADVRRIDGQLGGAHEIFATLDDELVMRTTERDRYRAALRDIAARRRCIIDAWEQCRCPRCRAAQELREVAPTGRPLSDAERRALREGE